MAINSGTFSFPLRQVPPVQALIISGSAWGLPIYASISCCRIIHTFSDILKCAVAAPEVGTTLHTRVALNTRKQLEKMSDFDLVVACQQNNHLAFEVLLERNRKNISAALFKLAPDWKDHSDMTQEITIRIWRSITTLRNPHAFHRWLNQLIKHLFFDELDYRTKTKYFSLDEPIDEDEGYSRLSQLPDTRQLPDEITHRRELMKKIINIIEDLPNDFKNILIMREFEGRPYGEIAATIGLELGTTKSRLSRARRKVQVKLQNYLAS